jgi:hypothetical protein
VTLKAEFLFDGQNCPAQTFSILKYTRYTAWSQR